MGKKRITYVELQTLVDEVELMLNNRPIGVDYYDEIEDVLTPNHLMFGRRLETCNDVTHLSLEFTVDNDKIVNRKKLIDTMLNHFWERWRKEYLTSLRESQKVVKQKKSTRVAINDIVLVYEEKQPRHLWRMGKINRLIAG